MILCKIRLSWNSSFGGSPVGCQCWTISPERERSLKGSIWNLVTNTRVFSPFSRTKTNMGTNWGVQTLDRLNSDRVDTINAILCFLSISDHLKKTFKMKSNVFAVLYQLLDLTPSLVLSPTDSNPFGNFVLNTSISPLFQTNWNCKLFIWPTAWYSI